MNPPPIWVSFRYVKPPKNTRQQSSSSADISGTDKSALLLEKILDRLTDIETKIHGMEVKINALEKRMNYHAETAQVLKKDVDVTKSKMPNLEQNKISLFNKSIQIQGIPHHTNEDAVKIITAIGEKVQAPVDANNVQFVYRNKSKKFITVIFIQTHVRNDFVSKK